MHGPFEHPAPEIGPVGRSVVGDVLEVNPRASRTVPFVAKATGLPVAKIAAKGERPKAITNSTAHTSSWMDRNPARNKRTAAATPRFPGEKPVPEATTPSGKPIATATVIAATA